MSEVQMLLLFVRPRPGSGTLFQSDIAVHRKRHAVTTLLLDILPTISTMVQSHVYMDPYSNYVKMEN